MKLHLLILLLARTELGADDVVIGSKSALDAIVIKTPQTDIIKRLILISSIALGQLHWLVLFMIIKFHVQAVVD